MTYWGAMGVNQGVPIFDTTFNALGDKMVTSNDSRVTSKNNFFLISCEETIKTNDLAAGCP